MVVALPLLLRARTIGVTADREGITAQGLGIRRRLPWDEIVGLDVGPPRWGGPNPMLTVRVMLRSGDVRPLDVIGRVATEKGLAEVAVAATALATHPSFAGRFDGPPTGSAADLMPYSHLDPDDVVLPSGMLSGAVETPCDEPHRGSFVAQRTLAGPPEWPGVAALLEQAADVCRSDLEPHLDDVGLAPAYDVPDAGTWADRDLRVVACAVVRADGVPRPAE